MTDSGKDLGVHCDGKYIYTVFYGPRFNLEPSIICPIRSTRYNDSGLPSLTCCNPNDCPLVVWRHNLDSLSMRWTLANPDSRFRHLKIIGERTYLEE